ncbi:MAG: diguanylate cyclase [Desulfuromonas sp.]|nr:diguanylate cyclase [Desulfuromonas sp.]
MRRYRLRLKITLLLLCVFLLAFVLQGSLVSSYLQRIYLHKLNQEHSYRLQAMVEVVDRKLANAHATIQALAQMFPKDAFANAEVVQSWLDNHAELLLTFDNGLFVFDPYGALLVESPFRAGRRGRDFSFRPYFQQTARTLQPVISDPYISSLEHGHKTLMMTVPVLGSHGELLAILGGSIDLYQENFLGRISHQKLGEKGFFFVAALDRTLIVHPDPERFPQQRIEAGDSLIFDLAISGFEGSTVGESCRGDSVLFTVKRFKNKDWLMCSTLPLEELLAPVRSGSFALWAIIGVTTALILLVVVLALRLIFKPLFLFSAHMRVLPDKQGAQRQFIYKGDDELSTLIDTFNDTLKEMDAARAELNNAQQMSHIGSWKWDLNSDEIIWSDEGYRIFGEHNQASLATYAQFLGYVHPDDRPVLEQNVADALRDKSAFSLQYRIVLRNQQTRYAQGQGDIQYDQDGKPYAIVGTVQDVTDQVLLMKRLNELATIDELTGTMNRRQLISVLEIELSRFHRYGQPFSVLFFDLDHFKAVNDTYGHQIGDQALRHVCDVVRLQLRDSDGFGRYGGEEFCVLLPDSTPKSACALAERIRIAVAQTPLPMSAEGAEISSLTITISVGVTAALDDDNSATLLKRADFAVYQAKDDGRNCSVML